MNITSKGGFLKKASPYLYLLPALATMAVFTLYPLGYAVFISFTDYSLDAIGRGETNFIGIDNYIDIINGPYMKSFLSVFGWNIAFAFLTTALSFVFGLFLAVLLSNKNMKESNFYKAILIIPWTLPGAIAAISWQGLLNSEYGAINILLLNLNIIQEPIIWLNDPFWARVAVVIASVWLGFPYMMSVCIGALSAIPDTYYEVADLDGASKATQFFNITLPSIALTAYPLLISSFAFNFNNIGNAYLITSGGPPGDQQWAGKTDILASMTYKLTMESNVYGISSALAVLSFFVIGTITFVNMFASGQFKEVD